MLFRSGVLLFVLGGVGTFFLTRFAAKHAEQKVAAPVTESDQANDCPAKEIVDNKENEEE